jgi:hypothetical protein
MQHVSFLIAGMQKAGTSALRYYLRQHRSIWMGETKEAHFFDEERVDWSSPPYDLFHKHCMSGAPQGAVCGEATPIYTFWPPSLDRIADYSAGMKFIILLRDPIARAYSHWSMMVERDVETLSFSEAIRGGRARVDLSRLLKESKHFSYVERGLYAEQITRLWARFPRDQLLLLSTNELFVDHGAALRRVTRFLGVPNFETLPEFRVARPYTRRHSLPPISTLDVDYLAALFRDDVAETRRLTGIDYATEEMAGGPSIASQFSTR